MTEKEWRMFNDILLEIYYAGSLETFGERCLKLIRILIPYTQGRCRILYLMDKRKNSFQRPAIGRYHENTITLV